MAKSRTDIHAIKERIDTVSVISRYVTLTKSGSSHKGRCPFHKDDTPSMVVSAEKGLWHCFGCGEGGDVIAFVMKIEGLSFVEAAKRLATEAGLSFETGTDESGEREEMRVVTAEAARYFAENLRSAPQGAKAREYLTNRGYEEADWKRFGLGYALPGWESLKRIFAARCRVKLLTELGLVVQGKEGTYDRFRDRAIFPIYDLSDRPIAFGGRAFEGQPKYLNSPKTPLFDKGHVLYGLSWARESLSREKTALLVEGYTDVISLHQAGLTTAVGSMGTALTQGLAVLLARFVRRVVILYDRDAAGGAASLRGMQILRNSGLSVEVAQLGEGEDPDSVVRQDGPDAILAAVSSAVPFYQFYVDSLRAQHDGATLAGKEQMLGEAREFYRSISSLPLRQEFSQQLAGLLDLPAEGIMRELTRRRRIPSPPRIVEQDGAKWTPEEDLLVLLLRGEIAWSRLARNLSPEDFSLPNRSIATALAKASEVSDLGDVVDELDETSARRASFYALAPVEFSNVEQVVEDALAKLVRVPAIERELRELDAQIRACDERDDRNRWNELTKQKIMLVAEKLGRRGTNAKGQSDKPSEAEARG